MSEEQQAVGSIGALWPPGYDARNDRIKGFYLNTVSDWKQYSALLDTLFTLRDQHGASRITARCIVQNATEIAQCGVEARIPLDGGWLGHSLVYFGQNTSARYAPEKNEPPEIAAQEDTVVRETMLRMPAELEKEVAKVRAKGFDVSVLGVSSTKDVTDITALYAEAYKDYTIPLDEKHVHELVSNKNNLVGIVREGFTGTIISIGIAERVYQHITGANLPEGKMMFKFAELSDAATNPNPQYEKKGLYTTIALFLMEKLAQEEFDLVYGEARACRIAVNHACRRTGRTYTGRLLKHCKLDGKREIAEEGPFENLNVWAITHDKLQKFFNRDEDDSYVETW